MQNFNELKLSAQMSKAIEELGYTTPTPVQAETLPLLLEGPTDFLGLAATGTGKTAAFAIPLLEGLNNSVNTIQALVLCPTRELALQVTQQINLLGKYKKLTAVAIYGGAGYGDQIRGLKQGAQIVVATPGRLIDHLERRTLSLDKVQTVILDEADEMISMGFKDEIESILESVSSETYNTWLFSATMSRDVRKVADKFLTEPKMVQINKTEMLSGTVRQIYYKVRESDKADILCKLIDISDDFYGLVFCQTKSLVTDLTTLLNSRGYKVESLHGDKDQNQRERTMAAFRERRVNILVCTDVASRGIDVKDLTHVVNYSIPRELDSYVHRIGRTGRSGKAGLALSLVTPSHMGLIGRIENMTQSKIEPGVIPSRKEIGTKKVTKVLETFLAASEFDRVIDLLSEDWIKAMEGMSKAEIASRLLVLTFKDLFIEREKMQMPGNPAQDGGRRGRDEGGRSGGRGFDRGGSRGGDFKRGPRRDFGGDRDRGGEGRRDRGGERSFGGGGERRERSFGGPREERSFAAPRAEGAGGEERSFGGGAERSDRGGERSRGSYGAPRDRGAYGAPRDREPRFGGERRERSFGAPRERSFGAPRERSFGAPREERSFGGGEERRFYPGERRDRTGGPRREFGGDRERRDFGGGSERRSFGGDREAATPAPVRGGEARGFKRRNPREETVPQRPTRWRNEKRSDKPTPKVWTQGPKA